MLGDGPFLKAAGGGAVAEVQITAEQLLKEAASLEKTIGDPRRSLKSFEPKRVRGQVDDLELADYRARRRKAFEDNVRGKRHGVAAWIKYAQFEIEQRDIRRARSIYERALEWNSDSIDVWEKYLALEASANVDLARRLFERAVTVLPRVARFWLRYAAFEEAVALRTSSTASGAASIGYGERARAIFQRWTDAPHVPAEAFVAWADLETRLAFKTDTALASTGATMPSATGVSTALQRRLNRVERAREVLDKLLKMRPTNLKAFLVATTWYQQHHQPELARAVYTTGFRTFLDLLNNTRDFDLVMNAITHEVDVAELDRKTGGRATSTRFVSFLIAFAESEEKGGNLEKAREVLREALQALRAVKAPGRIVDTLIDADDAFVRRSGTAEDVESAAYNRRLDRQLRICFGISVDKVLDLLAGATGGQVRTTVSPQEASDFLNLVDRGLESKSLRQTPLSTDEQVKEIVLRLANMCTSPREAERGAEKGAVKEASKEEWKPYTYFIMQVAMFFEIVMGNFEQAQLLWDNLGRTVPHRQVPFAKIWTETAGFYIRRMDVTSARKTLGRGIGLGCRKLKLYKFYVDMELKLGEIDRARKVAATMVEKCPQNPDAWLLLAAVESNTNQGRVRAIYVLDRALQSTLPRSLKIFEALIDFHSAVLPDVGEDAGSDDDDDGDRKRKGEEREDVREESAEEEHEQELRDIIQGFKQMKDACVDDPDTLIEVIMAEASFELGPKRRRQDCARAVLEQAQNEAKKNGQKALRAALLRRWLKLEIDRIRALDSEGKQAPPSDTVFIKALRRRQPRQVVVRKLRSATIENEDDVDTHSPRGEEAQELVDEEVWLFPDDEDDREGPSGGDKVVAEKALSIVEAARKWRQSKAASASPEKMT